MPSLQATVNSLDWIYRRDFYCFNVCVIFFFPLLLGIFE